MAGRESQGLDSETGWGRWRAQRTNYLESCYPEQIEQIAREIGSGLSRPTLQQSSQLQRVISQHVRIGLSSAETCFRGHVVLGRRSRAGVWCRPELHR